MNIERVVQVLNDIVRYVSPVDASAINYRNSVLEKRTAKVVKQCNELIFCRHAIFPVHLINTSI